MGKKLERFFKGSSKPMRLGFVGFVVAFIGVTLGFVIDYRSGNHLAYVDFGIVTVGVIIVLLEIAWDWNIISRKIFYKSLSVFCGMFSIYGILVFIASVDGHPPYTQIGIGILPLLLFISILLFKLSTCLWKYNKRSND